MSRIFTRIAVAARAASGRTIDQTQNVCKLAQFCGGMRRGGQASNSNRFTTPGGCAVRSVLRAACKECLNVTRVRMWVRDLVSQDRNAYSPIGLEDSQLGVHPDGKHL